MHRECTQTHNNELNKDTHKFIDTRQTRHTLDLYKSTTHAAGPTGITAHGARGHSRTHSGRASVQCSVGWLLREGFCSPVVPRHPPITTSPDLVDFLFPPHLLEDFTCIARRSFLSLLNVYVD